MTAPALVAVLSTLAAVVGIFGIVPQLVAMLRSRSSAGQSPVGWCLGVTCHAAMAFVNLVGYHATVLAAGNLLSLTGCLTAVWLVVRFRAPRGVVGGVRAGEPARAPEEVPSGAMADLHTQELMALRDAVLVEHHRRTRRGAPARREAAAA